eukprot:CAMPEP_0172633906 /NCGR_PEP_ID=MMETSP1068-20121228/191820_1 /TAXON_ID=35684 /ORGANISM="Pseudopedinella elastica, Strain CCMP716" /LENGTH=55 /DNA_ID=CAMNT_0013445723 /DNA_START=52 /DNA_END=215 /DNA_ORIENTATION=-
MTPPLATRRALSAKPGAWETAQPTARPALAPAQPSAFPKCSSICKLTSFLPKSLA